VRRAGGPLEAAEAGAATKAKERQRQDEVVAWMRGSPARARQLLAQPNGVAEEAREAAQARLADASTGEEKRLGRRRSPRQAAPEDLATIPLPTGHAIAFNEWTGKRDEIFVVDTSGIGQRKLAPTFLGETDWQVAWSPDGARLAFLGTPALPPPDVGDVSLYLVNRDGTGLRKLVDRVSSKNLNTPEWSPDGSKLLIERSGIGGERDFAYVVNTGGDGLRRVAANTDFTEWSPDGRRIAFIDQRQRTLYVVSASGGPSKPIPRNAWAPDW
jgi:Tol biopolymer transport system component